MKSSMRPSYHKIRQVFDSNLSFGLKNLTSLKGRYAGKRIFIMGNGPSLNQTDLTKLEHEFVWGSNRCYLLYDRINWRPSFYTSVDSLVVPDIANEINALTAQADQTMYFFPMEFYLKKILHFNDRVIFFRQLPINSKLGVNGYFSTTPNSFLRTPNTVTITALQLAVHLGFNPIYLIGCDTNYIIPNGVEAKGQAKDPGTGEIISGYELKSLFDNDPNHFDSRYFGSGSRWHAPNVNGMIYGYQMVKIACDELGVSVLNATVGGMLEVFPRVNFDSLFTKSEKI